LKKVNATDERSQKIKSIVQGTMKDLLPLEEQHQQNRKALQDALLLYRPPALREQGNRGVGLGLSLVRQIALHHGGVLRCLQREGGGTAFEVELRGSSTPPKYS
jgi:K+-sensing histidine kinase KdpD